jgi:transcriptional regulator with XRE-family HTH domain
LRRRQNVKRHYLAVQLGVSVAAIDKMEQAVTHPNFGQVFLLTKAMGITMHEFADAFEQELVRITPSRKPLKG